MAHMCSKHSEELVLLSLGHFIIDEIVLLESETPILEPQLGGGGFYAILGARLWLAPHQVGLIVNRGHDFPASIQRRLDSYGECWSYSDYPDQPSFRARTTITATSRTFEALPSRIWHSPASFVQIGLRAPKYLHLVCSPQQAKEAIDEMRTLGNDWMKTGIVFEPMPYECKAENLEALAAVLPDIKVFSPNEEEAARFLGVDLSAEMEARKTAIEGMNKDFLLMNPQKYVVIRSGALGACVASTDGTMSWVPAYYSSAEKIVDVTGAGNAFLGGLAAGLADTGDIVEAAMYGSVASSYMLEQYGPPSLRFEVDQSPLDRLRALKGRV